MELNDDFVYNIFCDFKKKNIDQIEKAKLIKTYIEEKGISQREFARQFGIPHSTVQDWLLWDRVTPEQRKEMHKNGLKDYEIYDLLRNNKHMSPKEVDNKLVKKNELDYELEQAISNLKIFKGIIHCSKDTVNLISDLQEVLNRLLFKIEKERKRN
jgi:hypothetical protein